jgi:REP element-mobilizing transposase RayT
MGLPRRRYVREGEEGVYHCFGRCVRRAFLYGFDLVTQRDFSHRKAWLVDRLRHLAGIFAVDVCAYDILENHYHTILRTRPDIVAGWTDREVATRWLTLCPRRHNGAAVIPPREEDIRTLVNWPERIAKLRQRLSSLSWFMAQLNEFIARAANQEDKVKGRFWEGRFKCQVLLDEAAIAACMVYVDLNSIRAGLAATPEESDFTSIRERILAWQAEQMTTAAAAREAAQEIDPGSFGRDVRVPRDPLDTENLLPERASAPGHPVDGAAFGADWLCPIQSTSRRRGILQMTPAEYIDLVDRSGRLVRSDKRGAIDAGLAPILLRIGARPEAWAETVSGFGSSFRLAAGLLSSLRAFAARIGSPWLQGIASARAAFALSPPQPA